MTALVTTPATSTADSLSSSARHPVKRTVPWRWLLVLAVGTGLFAAVSATLVVTHDLLFVPCLLLLGAAVVPATLTTLVTESMASHRLPLARVLTAAVLGGVVGAVLAGLLEFGTRQALGSMPYLMIGLIEETAKLAIPLTLFAWGRSRGRAMDGLVLGVAAGSGFAALETMGYGFVALLATHGQLAPVDGLLITRALSSLGAHAAWTGLAAAAWFAIGSSRRRWFGWARFALTFATVVILHALWDATASGGFYRFVAAVSFVLLVGTAACLYRRARREDDQMVLHA